MVKLHKIHRQKLAFARITWRIMGGAEIDMADAAKKLRMHPAHLYEFFRGERSVSQEAIREKNWRSIFAAQYSETWQRYRAEFDAAAAHLTKAPSTRTREPDSKESFGHALWQVIGGARADISLAADRLHITVERLSNLIHGKKRTTRKFITTNEWIPTLKKSYRHGWQKHGDIFMQRLGDLRAAPFGIKAPKTTDNFGHTLWLMIGGENASIPLASKRLKLTAHKLSALIHDQKSISQDAISVKGWRETFARHYAKTWQEHGEAFECKVAFLARAQHRRKHDVDETSVLKVWRQAVGAFVRAVRQDQAEPLAPSLASAPPELQDENIWRRIETGDPALPLTLFRAAASDVVVRHGVSQRPETAPLLQKAKNLLADYG